jgi:hypothetical protein
MICTEYFNAVIGELPGSSSILASYSSTRVRQIHWWRPTAVRGTNSGRTDGSPPGGCPVPATFINRHQWRLA